MTFFPVENDKDEKYVAQWYQAKWLLFSSLFFLVPATYAFLSELYLHSLIIFFTSVISANYWRKATYSWRRDLDLLFSKFCFVVFVSIGIFIGWNTRFFIPGCIGLFIMIYSYHVSSRLSDSKDESWYKYHLIFHFALICELMTIVYVLSQNDT
jgi:hypothetical protein